MQKPKISLMTIGALAKNETAIGSLYREFAKRMPEEKDFWNHIAEEEDDHANKINILNDSVHAGNLGFREGRFNINDVERISRFIKEEMFRAKNGLLSKKRMYQVAEEIETGLLESKFFEVFDADDEGSKKILNEIRLETIEHLKSVRKHLSEVRD
jgi:hypothetical protein